MPIQYRALSFGLRARAGLLVTPHRASTTAGLPPRRPTVTLEGMDTQATHSHSSSPLTSTDEAASTGGNGSAVSTADTASTPSTGNVTYRLATEADRDFILAMFKETDTWGEDRPVSDSFHDDVTVYVDRWDEDQGGVIALEHTDRIGASWLLTRSKERPGSGFVSAEVPELAIALAPGNTGKGLGKQLLNRAVELARQQGKPGVSLAVDLGNDRAYYVYEKYGFVDQGLNPEGTCHVMYYEFPTVQSSPSAK